MMKKLNKAGMSLVELIVIVAILSATLYILPMSIGTIFTMNAKKCAHEIDTSLAMCKVNAMSRSGDIYVCFFRRSDGIYYEYYEKDISRECEKIGKSTLAVIFKDSLGNTSSLGTDPVYFSFHRGTGAFLTIKDAYALSGTASLNEGYYTSVTVIGNDKSYTVTLVPVTGKHYVTVEEFE